MKEKRSWTDQIRAGGVILEMTGDELMLWLPLSEDWDRNLPEIAVRLFVQDVPGGIPYQVSDTKVLASTLWLILAPAGDLAERWHRRLDDVREAEVAIAAEGQERRLPTIFSMMGKPRPIARRLRLIRGGA